jgi:hypothetical protein
VAEVALYATADPIRLDVGAPVCGFVLTVVDPDVGVPCAVHALDRPPTGDDVEHVVRLLEPTSDVDVVFTEEDLVTPALADYLTSRQVSWWEPTVTVPEDVWDDFHEDAPLIGLVPDPSEYSAQIAAVCAGFVFDAHADVPLPEANRLLVAGLSRLLSGRLA